MLSSLLLGLHATRVMNVTDHRSDIKKPLSSGPAVNLLNLPKELLEIILQFLVAGEVLATVEMG